MRVTTLLLLLAICVGCSAEESTLYRTFCAVCAVESHNNPKAHNLDEDARGIAQIRAIMVEDVNRIRRHKSYVHDDAWDVSNSYSMFRTYSLHYYSNGSPEQWARAWNGGPQGPQKESTLPYWHKVKQQMENNMTVVGGKHD